MCGGSIYYVSPEQKQAAEASKAEEQARKMEAIVTEIVPSQKFWPAVSESHTEMSCSSRGSASGQWRRCPGSA